MSDFVAAKGTPLDLERIADKALAEALREHHTEGQRKCVDHVFYRYTGGAWISTGERG